jgi:hypothetical protein
MSLKDDIENMLLSYSSGAPEEREQWRSLYTDKMGTREMKIPQEASVFSKILATPIALATIYGNDAINWTKFIGDALSGRSNPSLEDITMWSMGALGGGTAFGRRPAGSLGMGGGLTEESKMLLAKNKRLRTSLQTEKLLAPANKAAAEAEAMLKKLDDEARIAVAKAMNNPEKLAKVLGLKYQGKWPDVDLYEFRDEVTKGNFTVKSLNDVEKRLQEIRSTIKPMDDFSLDDILREL